MQVLEKDAAKGLHDHGRLGEQPWLAAASLLLLLALTPQGQSADSHSRQNNQLGYHSCDQAEADTHDAKTFRASALLQLHSISVKVHAHS